MERALVIEERHYGPDHAQVAFTLVSLGNAYGVLGDYIKMNALLERALAINEHHYDPALNKVAFPLSGLALAHKAQGGLASARRDIDRARRLFANGYGINHPQSK